MEMNAKSAAPTEPTAASATGQSSRIGKDVALKAIKQEPIDDDDIEIVQEDCAAAASRDAAAMANAVLDETFAAQQAFIYCPVELSETNKKKFGMVKNSLMKFNENVEELAAKKDWSMEGIGRIVELSTEPIALMENFEYGLKEESNYKDRITKVIANLQTTVNKFRIEQPKIVTNINGFALLEERPSQHVMKIRDIVTIKTEPADDAPQSAQPSSQAPVVHLETQNIGIGKSLVEYQGASDQQQNEQPQNPVDREAVHENDVPRRPETEDIRVRRTPASSDSPISQQPIEDQPLNIDEEIRDDVQRIPANGLPSEPIHSEELSIDSENDTPRIPTAPLGEEDEEEKEKEGEKEGDAAKVVHPSVSIPTAHPLKRKGQTTSDRNSKKAVKPSTLKLNYDSSESDSSMEDEPSSPEGERMSPTDVVPMEESPEVSRKKSRKFSTRRAPPQSISASAAGEAPKHLARKDPRENKAPLAEDQEEADEPMNLDAQPEVQAAPEPEDPEPEDEDEDREFQIVCGEPFETVLNHWSSSKSIPTPPQSVSYKGEAYAVVVNKAVKKPWSLVAVGQNIPVIVVKQTKQPHNGVISIIQLTKGFQKWVAVQNALEDWRKWQSQTDGYASPTCVEVLDAHEKKFKRYPHDTVSHHNGVTVQQVPFLDPHAIDNTWMLTRIMRRYSVAIVIQHTPPHTSDHLVKHGFPAGAIHLEPGFRTWEIFNPPPTPEPSEHPDSSSSDDSEDEDEIETEEGSSSQ